MLLGYHVTAGDHLDAEHAVATAPHSVGGNELQSGTLKDAQLSPAELNL